MNVTEVRDSDFKNDFPGIFNFTVGILVRSFPILYETDHDILPIFEIFQ